MQSRWYDGVFVGVHGQSNDFLIGTPDGICRARTIKRKPLPERWDTNVLNTFTGLPWKHRTPTRSDDLPPLTEHGPAAAAQPCASRDQAPSVAGGDIHTRTF